MRESNTKILVITADPTKVGIIISMEIQMLLELNFLNSRDPGLPMKI